MNPLNLVPPWLWAALLGAAVLTNCHTLHQRDAARVGQADAKREMQQLRADQATAVANALEQQRLQLNQTLVTQGKAADDARDQRDAARRAAVSERAAAGELQQRIDQLTARACGASGGATAAGGGQAAQEAADLLAYVRGRLDEARAGTIEFADGAAIAGAFCERAYDALTPR